MKTVCPCVTAPDAHAYREQMARVAPFAKRVHIDFSDGELAPVKLVNPIQAYWPEGILADLHLMVKNPAEHIETVISLQPHMVIFHAEAEGDLLGMMRQLRAVNIKTGVALLQSTDPEAARNLIADADHVLIFSGDLGHFGGTADLTLLKKVGQIRGISANVEVGWDGGVSPENIAQLSLGGVEVFNAGGAIQHAPDPQEAYATLEKNIPKELAN
jgi:ribulose-phosphate 3-epimerase